MTIAAVGVGVVGWRILLILRDRVRAEPGLRRRLLMRGSLAIAAAVVIAVVVPRLVGATQESPAGLVVMLFGWMVAGMLGLLGVIAALAASIG